MSCPVVAFVVSTRAASPFTVTCSVTPAICSVNRAVAVCPERTRTFATV
jgi:hypothetical protein